MNTKEQIQQLEAEALEISEQINASSDDRERDVLTDRYSQIRSRISELKLLLFLEQTP